MSTPHPAIGALWHPAHIAELAQAHLAKWSETYLAALGHQYHGDPGYYAKVATWGQVPDPADPGFRRGHVAPAILITPDGVATTQGQDLGTLSGDIRLGCLIYTVANSRETALATASVYLAHVYTIVTQHPHLDGLGSNLITWDRAELVDLPQGQQTEGWARVELTVTLPLLAEGGTLDAPIQGRALPDQSTIDDVATSWIVR